MENIIDALVNSIYTEGQSSLMFGTHNAVKYFNHQLFKEFSPDINGYILVFFIPPPFTFLPKSHDILKNIGKFVTFAAIDFSPPQLQIQSTSVNPHIGGIPFAGEVFPNNQFNITYIDNDNLDIYAFHAGWMEYIKGITEGLIPGTPPSITIDSGSNPFHSLLPDDVGDIEMGIDYVGAFFIVKYDPSIQRVKYVGKCTGVYPQNIPSKELIGQRSSNEIVTLPFNYMTTYFEESLDSSHPVWAELESAIGIFE